MLIVLSRYTLHILVDGEVVCSTPFVRTVSHSHCYENQQLQIWNNIVLLKRSSFLKVKQFSVSTMRASSTLSGVQLMEKELPVFLVNQYILD